MPTIIPVYDEFGSYASTKAAGFNNPRNPVRRLTENGKDDTSFSLSVFENAEKYSVNEDQSIFIENIGGKKFKYSALPKEVQLAPVNAVLIENIASSEPHLFLVGNDFGGNPFEGNDDASKGLVIDGEKFQTKQFSGFRVDGVGSDLKKIKLQNGKKLILVSQNKARLLAFESY